MADPQFDLETAGFVFDEKEINECKAAFQKHGAKGCEEYYRSKQDEWRHLPLNIAIIGSSGMGKSSFINAIRGLTADDEGAAAVDVVETTQQPTPYVHPNNPLLKFWDLPGCGTKNFPKDGYLQKIEFSRYDFFLLLAATRFTETDVWLGNEINKLGKKYYYVRTKIGMDVSNDKKAHPREHNENAVFAKILQNIYDSIDPAQSAKVFLIDSYERYTFDFAQLETCLLADFPELKREALLFSLTSLNRAMVLEKARALQSRIWKAAALSAGIAAIPIPGTSLCADMTIILAEATFYFTQLGLDESSIKKLATLTGADKDSLLKIVHDGLPTNYLTQQGIKMLVQFLRGSSVVEIASEELAKLIPVVGLFIAAPLSFGGTYGVLRYILNRAVETALTVIETAAQASAAKVLAD